MPKTYALNQTEAELVLYLLRLYRSMEADPGLTDAEERANGKVAEALEKRLEKAMSR